MDPKTYKNNRLFDKAQKHQTAWDNAGVIIYLRDGTMCMYQKDGEVSDFGGRKTPRDTDRKATAIRNCLKRSGIELERSQLTDNLLLHDGYNIFFTLRDEVPDEPFIRKFPGGFAQFKEDVDYQTQWHGRIKQAGLTKACFDFQTKNKFVYTTRDEEEMLIKSGRLTDILYL